MDRDTTVTSGRALLDESRYSQREKFQHDPLFRGPLSRRSCTDVFCLLFFFVLLIVFGFIGYFAYREGDLNRILIPRDTNGLQCGQDSEVIDSKFLVFFDLSKCADPLVPINGCPTTQTCVKQCPSENFVHDKRICARDGVQNYRKRLICTRKIQVDRINSCDEIEKFMERDECAKWYLKSEPFFNLCLSDLLPVNYECSARMYDGDGGRRIQRDLWSSLANNFNLSLLSSLSPNQKCERVDPAKRRMLKEKFEIAESYLGRFIANILRHFTDEKKVEAMGQLIVEDTINTWPILACGLIGAAVCSLVVIAIMRWVAGPIVWLSIIGLIALLGTGIYFSYLQYDHYSKNPVDRFNLQPNLRSYFNSYFVEASTWLYILIGVSVVMVIILLFVLIFWKRIIIAIALIKEGSKAVSGNIATVFFPVFPWILQAIVIIFSILMFLHLASVGEPEHKITGMQNATSCQCTGNYSTIKDGDSCNPTVFNDLCHDSRFKDGVSCTSACVYVGLKSTPMVQYFKLINVFVFLWLLFFISAFGEMVLAGTFARWYWTMNKSDVPFFTVTGSIYRTLRFHLGTLAFGSFIITVCRIIRIMLEYLDRKLKKWDNECTKAVMCCCRGFFWLLENFLKFLNRNAYIMCAIHGKNFFSSSKDAFNLISRNILRVIALDKTTDCLFFLSKLLLSLGMAACTFTYLTSEYFNQHFPNVLLHYPFAQVIFIFIGSYFIATIFFGVYSMAVDTLFMCFLEDSERNDGSPDRPFFMSKELKKILKKSNK